MLGRRVLGRRVCQHDLIAARTAGLVLPACRIGSLARTTFLSDESTRERVTLDHLAFHALDYLAFHALDHP